jgi:indolepyruvate ferredoxin oxidoreductase
MALATNISLDDKYDRLQGTVLLSGTQALVRLPLMQRARDLAAGLNTAGYISGYRGSPLGGYDQQLKGVAARLAAAHVRFEPGVNEDLAATAIWGTQQVPLLPAPRYDGVFAIWYGKGPGVDRSGDPIKHANRMGTSAHGGVLVVFGDDHGGKSSTVSHQSEQALVAAGVPVLYPANVQEFLDFGLHGFALSRYAGVWVGFKCVNETVESTATVDVDPARVRFVDPGQPLPPDGVHVRFRFDPLGDEVRLARHKLPRVQAYVRANGLDRRTHGAARPGGLGILTAGKAWLDVVSALDALGLDAPRLEALGVAVYKAGVIWPLEPTGLAEFARGLGELLVVEEKAPFLEGQAAHVLYNLADGDRPRLSGKRTPDGTALLPADVPFEPLDIARVIGGRLCALGLGDAALEARLGLLEARVASARERESNGAARTPYFCSGCPHNTSTRVPDGSVAFAGIGCHTMALYMNRSTLLPTQMGGEGMTWVGAAPFSGMEHAFQNIGDGTYFHSGLLAIRAAVAAGTRITYKLLYNDAVAMTGGQAVEGGLTVADIARQLRAERVGRLAVVSDDPAKYGRAPGFPEGVTIHPRSELDAVQRQLRAVPGVSVLIYDQVCAAEKRRRRKRGKLAEPARRVFINPQVCEGCGDCSVKSNCVSVEPLETPFGRKRAIDQSACNRDYSCLEGFCPSFVTVSGASPRREAASGVDASVFAALPPAPQPSADAAAHLLITGIGGTGVVTVGALVAMAAHLEGRAASTFDMTGLAQKGGAVQSHVKVAPDAASLGAPRVGMLEADVILGCDLVVAGSAEVLRSIDTGRTRCAVNSHLVPTGAFQLNPDLELRADGYLARIAEVAGDANVGRLDATRAARLLLGDSVGANLLVVGYALQRGWLPVGIAALDRAIELNGVAVEFNRRALALGRLAAAEPARFAALLESAAGGAAPAVAGPADVATRAAFLAGYQDEAYAARFRDFVARAAAAETSATPGRREFADAVARSYFRLLAYKDEYEVARLHAGDEFRAALARAFSGSLTVRFHLAPPWLAKSRDGRPPRKVEFGAWVLPAFALLARLRRLRGTPFDPFGRQAERRLERQLISDYERLVGELLTALTPERHALAVELASLWEQARGFGHVKAAAVERLRAREASLLEAFRAAAPTAGSRAA